MSAVVREDRRIRRDRQKYGTESQGSELQHLGGDSEQIIIVMRHGERRDGALGAVSEVDPPLTEQGIAQVEKTAQRLRSLLKARRAKKLLIIVSPFLRTLQTAQQLRNCGIGTVNPPIIDNTLSEVYGPLRIKSTTPPSLPENIVRSGCGELPPWGESIELASQRYVENMQRNSRLYQGQDLLLVTHGDAIGAIMNAVYPMRTVYEAEYLSFIVFKTNLSSTCGSGVGSCELICSSGVQWLLEEPETSSAEVLALESESITGNSASNPHAIASCNATFRGYKCRVAAPAVNEEEEEEEEVVEEEEGVYMPYSGRGSALSKLSVTLRFATVFSQFLAFFTWSSTVNAAIYVAVVVAVELTVLGAKKCPSWRPLPYEVLVSVEHFPLELEEGCQAFFECRNHRAIFVLALQLIATVVKGLFIFALSIVCAFLANLAYLVSFDMLHSLVTGFTTPANAFVYLLFVVFSTARGYIELQHLRESG